MGVRVRVRVLGVTVIGIFGSLSMAGVEAVWTREVLEP